MRGKTRLLGKVKKAIEEYNRYRSPEAVAKLKLLRADSLLVEFTGSFCYTCGVYDYLDDLRVMFEEEGMKAEMLEVESEGDIFIVKFRLIRLETKESSESFGRVLKGETAN